MNETVVGCSANINSKIKLLREICRFSQIIALKIAQISVFLRVIPKKPLKSADFQFLSESENTQKNARSLLIRIQKKARQTCRALIF
ncbi:MAG: hypothetical protein AAF362_04845 [Pseudomonadota bacterium]